MPMIDVGSSGISDLPVKALSHYLPLCIALALPMAAVAQPRGHRATDIPRAPIVRKVVLPVPSAAQPAHPAVVRIYVTEQGSQSLGSGTLVDVREPYALVVTNWHVIRDATGEISVVFPDGFRSAARVVQFDADWDLAALSIWKPNVPPIRISSEPPKPGEPLTIAGYGSDGAFRAATGLCTQYVSPSAKHPHEIVELSAVARQGDSGGPILNTRGELAGVLFGTVDNTTSGSYGGRVLQFLAPLLKSDAAVTVPPGNSPEARGAAPTVAAPAIDPKQVTLPGIDDQFKSVNPAAPVEAVAPLAPVASEDAAAQEEHYEYVHTPLDAVVPGYSPTGHANPADWSLQTLLGNTPLEQGKAALAVVGLFAMLNLALRYGREPKSNG